MAQERLQGLALLNVEAWAKVMDNGHTYRRICLNKSKEKTFYFILG